ncbi:hypothetical protein MMC21_004298, partial [Puttea exsequens]|nr:hypothetical protein [Puttea exsequens]
MSSTTYSLASNDILQVIINKAHDQASNDVLQTIINKLHDQEMATSSLEAVKNAIQLSRNPMKSDLKRIRL